MQLKEGGQVMLFSKWEIRDLDGGRPGQIKCIEEFKKRASAWIEASRQGNFVFSIMMACRYGKSDVIRCIAVEALGLGVASCALVIHPFPDLSIQFLDDDRLKKWQKRWLPSLKSINVKRLKDFGEDTMKSDEWLGSIHIQALVPPGRKALLKQWVDHVKTETGLPPIIFVDETQSYSRNEWGTVPRLLMDMGCPIVVCTATPFRNDGDDVFGFSGEKDESKTETIETIFFTPNQEDPKTQIKTTTTKERSEFKISADVEVGFQQAWREKVIAKVTTLPIDFNCEGWGTKEGQSPKLSELPESEAKKFIPDLVRNDLFISEAVARMIEQLDEFRKAGVEKPAAIIFGMNDVAGNSNEHQEQIKAEIARQSNLECVVATMASDQVADEKSSKKISEFCCPSKKKGDVLLLKQMGSSGLDVDRCCVVVLLGPNRSQGQVIQQAMRGGNTTGTKSHFVIIYPHEKIMGRILGDWISENGGTFVNEEIILVETEVVPKGPPKDKGGFVPSDKSESGAGDHEGSTIPFEDVLLVKFGLTIFPEQKLNYTYPQLAVKFKRLGTTVPLDFVSQNQSLVETSAICDTLRKELFEIVKNLAGAEFPKKYGRPFNGGDPDDRSSYGKLKAQSVNRIKSRSGIDGTWDAASTQRSECVSDYRKWVAAGNDLLREVNQ
jgi:hypothetical protein